jgi:hypothetical protein
MVLPMPVDRPASNDSKRANEACSGIAVLSPFILTEACVQNQMALTEILWLVYTQAVSYGGRKPA